MSNAAPRAGLLAGVDRPWSAGFRTLSGEFDYRVDEIDGRVPAALRGTLFRNGAGRNDLGGHWFPHWFDGDGMISAIRFDDAGIHYFNRYVRTKNYLDETRAGRIVHRGFGKMRPGEIVFASSGAGSNTHIALELFRDQAGIKVTHVPYKGAGPAIVDVIGGQAQAMFADLPVLAPHIKSGRLRALAVAGFDRTPMFPEVPALKELGYPRFNARQWYGVFAPAGTPREIVTRLNETIRQSLAAPDLRDPLAAIGADVFVLSPEEFGAFVKGEIERWGVIIKKYGIKLEQ